MLLGPKITGIGKTQMSIKGCVRFSLIGDKFAAEILERRQGLLRLDKFCKFPRERFTFG